VEGATKQSLKPNVRQLLNAYLKHRAISRIDLANELRVDRSVIYALFRGERKCGMDVLRRIAHMVGCRIEDLLEMFDATAKRRAKSSD
jgi:ribosome-binding protein aMBF1 (putative translation factor)